MRPAESTTGLSTWWSPREITLPTSTTADPSAPAIVTGVGPPARSAGTVTTIRVGRTALARAATSPKRTSGPAGLPSSKFEP